MKRVSRPGVSRPPDGLLFPSFPEWAASEVDRLLRERAQARNREDRAQVELQLAVVCDAAQRYGNSLAEVAEL
jgi:hypothetical protein